MTITQFLLEVRRTAQLDQPDEMKLLIWSVALEGEWGELCNLVKKTAAHGHELDPQRIADELGDVVWYVIAILDLASQLPLYWPGVGGFSELADRGRDEQALLACGITSIRLKRFLQTVEHPVASKYRIACGLEEPDMGWMSTPQTEGKNLLVYLFALGSLFDLSRDTILETVVTKLRKRYPNGFTQQASRERVV